MYWNDTLASHNESIKDSFCQHIAKQAHSIAGGFAQQCVHCTCRHMCTPDASPVDWDSAVKGFLLCNFFPLVFTFLSLSLPLLKKKKQGKKRNIKSLHQLY